MLRAVAHEAQVPEKPERAPGILSTVLARCLFYSRLSSPALLFLAHCFSFSCYKV
jgi:hypothetical protein